MGPLRLTGGTDPMVAYGIWYVADLAETLDGPVIISMSLGGPEPSPMIEAAIDYAISKGVVVVASAGNEGYAGMGWPGAYPQVISCAMAGWTEQWFVGFWYDDVPEELNTPDVWGNNWQIYLDEISSRPNKTLGQKSRCYVTGKTVCIIGIGIEGEMGSMLFRGAYRKKGDIDLLKALFRFRPRQLTESEA